MTQSTQPAFSFHEAGVSFSSPTGERVSVLKGLDFSVSVGEIVALVGPSGCGKSTILNVLSREVALDEGTVLWKDATHHCPRIAAMWQEDQSLPWRTAAQNVEFPMEVAGRGRAEREAEAVRWLAAVGLKGFEGTYPAQLSGGMRKRVALAAALAAGPDVLLFDEPLAALDHWTKIEIQMEILAQWERTKPTILLVTHAADEAVAMADRIVILTNRPARVFRVHPNPLPRPRNLHDLYADAGFHDECRKVWALLKEAAAV